MTEKTLPPELTAMVDRAFKVVEVLADSFSRIANAYEYASGVADEFKEPDGSMGDTVGGPTEPGSSEGTDPRKDAKPPSGVNEDRKVETSSTLLAAPLDFDAVKRAIAAKLESAGEEEGAKAIRATLDAFGVERAGDLSDDKYTEFVVALGTGD